ncbi:MAG: protease modulator HflC [Treponemataceae bacterium]|nr:protease modulator HflC [Treponemataceae bacterium]
MKKFLIFLGLIFAFGVLFVALGPFYIVDEGSQVVVTRFGQIVSSSTQAGLHFRIPVIDEVVTYPKRILSLDGDPEPMPTKEKQYIIVDTTARWRITDPVRFYQSYKTMEIAYNRLGDIIDASTRMIIAQNRLSEVVRSSNLINESIPSQLDQIVGVDNSELEVAELETANQESEEVKKGRRQLTIEMAQEARKQVSEYGIEIIDIVPRQIKYSEEMTQSVYNRMIKDRNQTAQYYRSLGEGEKSKWLGKLENEKRAILSMAYKNAEEIKGNADAEATRIYAEAYSKDAEFYSFWKSLESYKETMPKFDATFSTDMQYFQYLYSANGR